MAATPTYPSSGCQAVQSSSEHVPVGEGDGHLRRRLQNGGAQAVGAGGRSGVLFTKPVLSPLRPLPALKGPSLHSPLAHPFHHQTPQITYIENLAATPTPNPDPQTPNPNNQPGRPRRQQRRRRREAYQARSPPRASRRAPKAARRHPVRPRRPELPG